MDTLATVAGVIAGIIVVVLILAVIAPKRYTVQRSIIINRPRNRVFEYIRFLRNQEQYSKWVMMDPNRRVIYTGTDGTVGFNVAWDSDMKQAGKGNQTIEEIIENERIDIRIVFEKPMAATADSYIAAQQVIDDSTLVKWAFDSKMPFPMNAMLLFINMDKVLGRDLDESLSNLKGILEA